MVWRIPTRDIGGTPYEEGLELPPEYVTRNESEYWRVTNAFIAILNLSQISMPLMSFLATWEAFIYHLLVKQARSMVHTFANSLNHNVNDYSYIYQFTS